MFIMGDWFARLCGQVAGAFDLQGLVAEEHAAPRCGDDLVAVEREKGKRSHRTSGAAVVAGTQCFSRVFDQRHTVGFTEFKDPSHLRALPVEMDDDDGFDVATRLQRRFEFFWIHIPGARFAVDEDRLRA